MLSLAKPAWLPSRSGLTRTLISLLETTFFHGTLVLIGNADACQDFFLRNSV